MHAVERLARIGHRLTRHLELEPLLDEAVLQLVEMTGADHAAVLTVDRGCAWIQAHHGMPDDHRSAWPRPARDLAAWPSALRGETYLGGPLHTGQEPPQWYGMEHPPRAFVAVPILHDGQPAAILYAVRTRNEPFTEEAAEIAALFASYVSAAMHNARLYRALAESESRLRLVTDAISDMIAVVSADLRIDYASPSYERETGLSCAALLGVDVTTLAHPADRGRLRDALQRAALGAKVEYRLQDGHGHSLWVETLLRPSGDGTVLSTRVVDDRKRLEAELWRRATHDPLTGLANRELARVQLEQALSDRLAGDVGLLFCDLDEFKSINDRLGHEAGDELLCQVAGRLSACAGPEDLVARLGGDEFVVVLDGVDGLEAVGAAGRRVLEALEPPFSLGGERVRASASIGGVCGHRRGSDTAVDLLRDADAAMYQAKGAGRARVEVFDELAARRAHDRLQLRSDLVAALDRGQLELNYQPVVELETGAVLGFEALLRWTHPLLGRISPADFIPLAEETGAIVPIGRWVLEQACAQLAAWQRVPGCADLRINVNVSAVQLRSPSFPREVLAAVSAHGVDPVHVTLELTETAQVSELHAEPLGRLAAAGMRIALDDFGTVYSNVGYLKRLPVGSIKIDRSFVAGVTTEDVDRGIVHALCALIDTLGLKVVAEGVETAEQRDELLRLGCRAGQGYLFAPPLPTASATMLLVDQERFGRRAA
jgi:diguanylate cyclase (GGDEF)-like protein/PAS domain S-box-containing protein